MHGNEIGGVIDDCSPSTSSPGSSTAEFVDKVTLARQLEKRGLSVQRQVTVPIEYGSEYFEEGFRAHRVETYNLFAVPL